MRITSIIRICGLCFGLVLACSISTASEVERLAEKISANYEKVGPFEATVVKTIEGRDSDNVVTQPITTAGNRTQFRCSIGEEKLIEYLRDGETYYRSCASIGSYVVSRVEDMPELGSLDPRDAGSNNLLSMSDCIRRAVPDSIRNLDEECILVVPGPSGLQEELWTIHFSRKEATLPVRSAFTLAGKKYLEIEVKYRLLESIRKLVLT